MPIYGNNIHSTITTESKRNIFELDKSLKTLKTTKNGVSILQMLDFTNMLLGKITNTDKIVSLYEKITSLDSFDVSYIEL